VNHQKALAMKRAEAQKHNPRRKEGAAKRTTGRDRGKAQKTAEAPLTVAAQ